MEQSAIHTTTSLADDAERDGGGAGVRDMRATNDAIACPVAQPSAELDDETYVHTVDLHDLDLNTGLLAAIHAAGEQAHAQADSNHTAVAATAEAPRNAQFDADALVQKNEQRARAAVLAHELAERNRADLAEARARTEFELAVQARRRAESESNALLAAQQRLLAEKRAQQAHEERCAAERAITEKIEYTLRAATEAARLRDSEGERLLQAETIRAAAVYDARVAVEAARISQEEAAASARERTNAELQLKSQSEAAARAERAATEQADAARRIAAEAEHAAHARLAAEAAATRAWEAQLQRDRGYAVAAAAEAQQAALESLPRGLQRWLVMLHMYTLGHAAAFGAVLIAAVAIGALARMVSTPDTNLSSQTKSQESVGASAVPCTACSADNDGLRLKLETTFGVAPVR